MYGGWVLLDHGLLGPLSTISKPSEMTEPKSSTREDLKIVTSIPISRLMTTTKDSVFRCFLIIFILSFHCLKTRYCVAPNMVFVLRIRYAGFWYLQPVDF